MGWFPNRKRAASATATAEEQTTTDSDEVLDPNQDETEDGSADDTAATDAAEAQALRDENETLKTENAALKARNESLASELKAVHDESGAKAATALEMAQDSAHTAAVRAFGQGSPKLTQAETDIAACESEREAKALERAYAAATPAALTQARRQTESPNAANAGKTTAQSRTSERTKEEDRKALEETRARF